MKLTWLGQVGLAIETEGRLIMVDPYLLDTLSETSGAHCNRLVEVDEKWLDRQPDMILLTHEHADHTDLPSLDRLLSTEKAAEVLAGVNAWKKVREHCKESHNYIMMKPYSQWTSENIRIEAIPSFHSDESGIGYIIRAEGLTIAVSGDTLFNSAIFEAVKESVDILYVVMNGKGNNMNSVDAARYAEAMQAKVAIPVHWGLFKQAADDPYKFAAEAGKRKIKTYIVQIYETLDATDIMEGKDGYSG